MKVAGRHKEKGLLDWHHEREGSNFMTNYGRKECALTGDDNTGICVGRFD